MANMVYPILIAIFAIAATTSYLNDSGLYTWHGVNVPVDANIPITHQLEEVNQTSQAMLDASKDSSFNAIGQLWMFGKAFLAGFIALFTIGPMLESWGIPLGLVGVFLSPMAFVVAMWLMEVFFGRSQE